MMILNWTLVFLVSENMSNPRAGFYFPAFLPSFCSPQPVPPGIITLRVSLFILFSISLPPGYFTYFHTSAGTLSYSRFITISARRWSSAA